MTDLPPLNCNGCTICCQGDTITLVDGDDPAAYETEVIAGKTVLAKGADGNCVYLGASGCNIHGRAPIMCKAMDCRSYALIFAGWDKEKQESRLANPLTARPIREGQRRLVAHAMARTAGGRPRP